MKSIILPIKKIYSDQIFAGTKRYEYRKSVPSFDIDKIYIYESQGIGKIVGEFTVKDIICKEKTLLYKETSQYSGISYDSYMEYFLDKENGYAYIIDNVKLYDEPVDIKTYGLKRAPQNFVWIDRY